MITLPTGLTLEDWVSQVTLDLGIPGHMHGVDWQAWGAQQVAPVINNLPNPYQFNNWRDWAERLCGVL